MKKKIIIIGGGASGMVAAIAAARRGGDVTILEQKNELGKKILATGNGRCNFTNLNMSTDHYYCEQNKFMDNLLSEYTPQVVINFFQSIGILSKDRGGYVYPLTDQAKSIRDALASELSYLGVDIRLDCVVERISSIASDNTLENFKIMTNQGDFICHTLILSTGGKSGLSPNTPMDGLQLIHDINHTYTNFSPALVPLKGQGKFYKKIAGIRTDGIVTAMIDGDKIRSEAGELQLTDYGISGIPIFQISRILTQELTSSNKADLSLEIDFLPTHSQEALEELLINRKNLYTNRTAKEILNGIFKDKLIDFLLYTARIDSDKQGADLTLDELKKFVRICKTFSIKINGSKDFSQAQVTAGGVPLTEINEHLESNTHNHLYFTGEVLDVDGICGGYNLHFAWSTGLLVGKHCVSEK